MKLQEFRFLADENVHPDVTVELREMGHDVLDIREAGLRGSTDAELLRIAAAENRVVITHDRDFGAMAIARSESFVGIVFLRPGHINPRFTMESLRSVFSANPDVRSPFIVVAKRMNDAVTIRIRNL